MGVQVDVEYSENANGAFYAGEYVSGKVVITLDKPKVFNDITLQIVGASKTKWSKGLGLQFRGKEEYFDTKVFLARPSDEDQFTLDAGTHYFDFECEIPENCPTSFESKHGRIRYTLAVVVSRPGKPNQTHKSAFTVLNVLDLNTFTPSVLESFSKEKSSKPGKIGFGPGISLKVDITHTGFIPGENIPVTITLDNPTDLNVDKLKLILNLLATYKSAIPEEAERKKILHINSSKISAVGKKCKRIFSEHIKIPATPPTCLYLSNIINIEYELDIVATIANFKGLFGVKVPLIIGIVPLHKYGRNIPSIRLTNNTKDTNRYSLDSVGFYPMNIDDRFESITEEEGAEEEEEEEEEQLPPYVPDQVDGAVLYAASCAKVVEWMKHSTTF